MRMLPGVLIIIHFFPYFAVLVNIALRNAILFYGDFMRVLKTTYSIVIQNPEVLNLSLTNLFYSVCHHEVSLSKNKRLCGPSSAAEFSTESEAIEFFKSWRRSADCEMSVVKIECYVSV